MLSGRYPTSTGVLDNHTWLMLDMGQKMLPRYFELQGYAAAEFGKIWHVTNDGTPRSATGDKEKAKWFTPAERAEQQRTQPEYWEKEVWSAYRNDPPKSGVFAHLTVFGPLPPDAKEPDTQIADDAIAQMGRFAQDKAKPFFLSVGFHKPHPPLKCPKELFDLFRRFENYRYRILFHCGRSIYMFRTESLWFSR